MERVFDLFTDLEGIESTIAGIKSIEVLEGSAKMEKGTTWKETRVMFGKEASETMSVTHIEPNKSYVVEAASHGMKYRSTYDFAFDGGVTTVHMEFSGTPVTFSAKLFSILGFLFAGATKKALKNDMLDLKRVAENS